MEYMQKTEATQRCFSINREEITSESVPAHMYSSCNCNKMTVWSVIIVLTAGSMVVFAQEKVCSSFCTSLGMLESSPGESCNDIYQINKMSRGVSGNYWINTNSGVQQVYCDMELQCGGHKGGWTRVAHFNTSQGDPCPDGWDLITTPGANPIDVCRSGIANECHSTMFDTYDISFYKICGRVRGYQKGNTNAFGLVGGASINEPYVDGVSITLGNPRKHVWTYAIGISDSGSEPDEYYCPCADTIGADPPSFVADHYYCESGDTGGDDASMYYTTDPVWDGLDCSDSVNCCTHPDMPWFLRQFATPQKTFIEARICRNENFSNEGTLVESMELYIQ